jgi:LmbE family N-acetylglucosaminyl deacetylase
MSTVLAICPHPDDEAIGCGGTLRLHALSGDEVVVVFLTSGENGGHGLSDAGTIREAEAKVAADILGIQRIEFLHEPDGKLEPSEGLARRLRSLVDGVDPTVVYAPHPDESHPDHQAAAALTRSVLADLDRPLLEWWQFEIWTPLREIDRVVDITDVVETKREAVRAYESQCRVMRLDEAIIALNRYRGEMHSWPGGDYAEIFTAGGPA